METVSNAVARPLILTVDQDLLDQLLRLCAAASVTPDVLGEAVRARQPWTRASAVLVGDDQAAAVARLGLARRDHVVLVSQARDPAPLWPLAVELRADDVALLPGGQGRLIERLSDLADGAANAATVGVIGGCGGAGSSTLAAGLAMTAAKAGLRSLLVDADPRGGGVELAVGCEDSPGLRWPDVAAAHGRVSAPAFRAALPSVGALAVLSWDRAEAQQPDPPTMRAMVSAAQRCSDVVVVDLPRWLDDAASEALLRADVLVMVATSDVRGVASARGMVADLRRLCADIRLVVRALPAADLTASTVAETLGLPLAGAMRTQRGIARAVNDGLGPLGHGRLERTCRTVIDSVTTSLQPAR